jgi:ribulose-phosphate 3-epimerase
MSRRRHLAELRQAAPQVLPSLLLCDFGNLEREVARLEEAGVAALHLDVMDGHFVPNFTYGLPVVEAFRRLTRLPLDVHLMIAQPERYVERFYAAGADILTIHVEAAENPRRALEQIRQLGAGAGLALNPNTPLAALEGSLDLCDVVLVMSVEAGFGRQSFQPVALEKLRALRRQVPPGTLLVVDGGINEATIGPAAEAGALLFVVGSAIFSMSDYGQAIRRLTKKAAEST